MPRYRKDVVASYYITYEVEAEDPEEAEGLFRDGHGEEVYREFREWLEYDSDVEEVEEIDHRG